MPMVWLYGPMKVLGDARIIVEYSLRTFILLSAEGDEEYYLCLD